MCIGSSEVEPLPITEVGWNKKQGLCEDLLMGSGSQPTSLISSFGIRVCVLFASACEKGLELEVFVPMPLSCLLSTKAAGRKQYSEIYVAAEKNARSVYVSCSQHS